MRTQAVGLLALLGVLAGCTETEPYERAGQWNPLGANAANLRAMVADPHDLELGRAPGPGAGDMGAAAVARLRSGTVHPLPSSSISGVRTTDTGTAPAGANEGATAAAPVA
ncbi:MAG: hypothetical protein ACJ8H8_08285, partial [Geminicoccaceae bacterium]